MENTENTIQITETPIAKMLESLRGQTVRLFATKLRGELIKSSPSKGVFGYTLYADNGCTLFFTTESVQEVITDTDEFIVKLK